MDKDQLQPQAAGVQGCGIGQEGPRTIPARGDGPGALNVRAHRDLVTHIGARAGPPKEVTLAPGPTGCSLSAEGEG